MEKAGRKIFLVLAVLLLLSTAAAAALLPRQTDVRRSTRSAPLPKSASRNTVTEILPDRYTVERLSHQSSLVVYGAVAAIREPVILKETDRLKVYTDVEITPKEVLRGEVTGPVVLRLPGGVKGRFSTDYSALPELFEGESCLLFLHRPQVGMGLYENSGCWYLTGELQGVFAEDPKNKTARKAGLRKGEDIIFSNREMGADGKNQVVVTDPAEEVPAENAVLSLNALRERYPAFNREFPADPEAYRRELEDTWKGNLEHGTVTEEEYAAFLDLLDEYAVELSEEEAAAWQKEESTRTEPR